MIDSAPVIKAALANDPSAGPEVRQRVLGAIGDGDSNSVEFLSVKESALLLECCPATVRRLAARGHLRQIRFSKRRVRYARNEVLRLRERGVEG